MQSIRFTIHFAGLASIKFSGKTENAKIAKSSTPKIYMHIKVCNNCL